VSQVRALYGLLKTENLYVVSESGTVKLSKITDTLKAMPLLSGSPIIIPSCC
jgi:hypothetical protein